MRLDPETQVQLLLAANLLLLLTLVAVTGVPAAIRELKALRQDLLLRRAEKHLRRLQMLRREVLHRQEMRQRRNPLLRVTRAPQPRMSSLSSVS